MSDNELQRRASLIGRVRRIFAVIAALSMFGIVIHIGMIAMMLLGGPEALIPPNSLPIEPNVWPSVDEVTFLALFLLLVAAGLLWLVWLFLSMRFVRRAGGRTRFSPWIGIVYHFVPVLGLVMPMLLLDELETALENLINKESVNRSVQGLTTGAVTKLAMILLVAAGSMVEDANSGQQYAVALLTVAAGNLLMLLALWLSTRFALKMELLQQAIAGRLQPDIPES
ncbi:DUF4328 domain-containing protein [Rhizobium alvei]|uniref:DUF4328 domain-containing protein n=1 Tax=Rhizobium alvei TaxID=1132659 RepID=A0ABT8YGX4_9HYPH|nr:DUF4328 domain-containing protein [Rhizobium alvei]MDO6962647.1 DUF4328 domain-containing protein [Rhizobium alvei]